MSTTVYTRGARRNCATNPEPGTAPLLNLAQPSTVGPDVEPPLDRYGNRTSFHRVYIEGGRGAFPPYLSARGGPFVPLVADDATHGANVNVPPPNPFLPTTIVGLHNNAQHNGAIDALRLLPSPLQPQPGFFDSTTIGLR